MHSEVATPLDGTPENLSARFAHGQPPSSVDTPEALKNKTTREDVNVTEIENVLLQKLNRHRNLNDLGTLLVDPRLSRIARQHSFDMATNDYFDHTNPEGQNYRSRLEEHNYDCYYGGENIQATFWKMEGKKTEEDMAREILYTFMGSAEHNEVMLQPDLTTVGIGIYVTEDRRTYITMDFCGSF